jgi:hypothetical protein
MGITNLLTVLFVALKLLEKINWSWWLVLSPSLLSLAVYICYLVWWELKSPLEKAQYIYKKKMGL